MMEGSDKGLGETIGFLLFLEGLCGDPPGARLSFSIGAGFLFAKEGELREDAAKSFNDDHPFLLDFFAVLSGVPSNDVKPFVCETEEGVKASALQLFSVGLLLL
jgi:hypothetical protein